MRRLIIGSAAGVLSTGFLVLGLAAPASATPNCDPWPSQGQAFASHASVAACLDGQTVAGLARSGHTR
jgi:hypothetical protein